MLHKGPSVSFFNKQCLMSDIDIAECSLQVTTQLQDIPKNGGDDFFSLGQRCGFYFLFKGKLQIATKCITIMSYFWLFEVTVLWKNGSAAFWTLMKKAHDIDITKWLVLSTYFSKERIN